jgi:hypothetical protein
MKIPKGTDFQVKTDNELVELHITSCITTRVQARELVAAIKQCETLLEGEKRIRKPKLAAVGAA